MEQKTELNLIIPIAISAAIHALLIILFLYNGIDRLNNEVGYIPGNVVSCCRLHNEWKRAMTEKAFIETIHRTSEFLKKKGLK